VLAALAGSDRKAALALVTDLMSIASTPMWVDGRLPKSPTASSNNRH
jgi:hypothetical protein